MFRCGMPLVLIGIKILGVFFLFGGEKWHCIATREEKRVRWWHLYYNLVYAHIYHPRDYTLPSISFLIIQ